jgi:bifunctional non-homologous end joining protein LigD
MAKASSTTPAVSVEGLQFVEPMYAGPVQTLPEGKDWLYEVKFDGYRCPAGRDSSEVTLLIAYRQPVCRSDF